MYIGYIRVRSCENTEISITVLPSDDIIGQDNSEVSEPKSIEGTRPIIAQIEKLLPN
jgi:hypothetical protein